MKGFAVCRPWFECYCRDFGGLSACGVVASSNPWFSSNHADRPTEGATWGCLSVKHLSHFIEHPILNASGQPKCCFLQSASKFLCNDWDLLGIIRIREFIMVNRYAKFPQINRMVCYY